MPIHLKIHPYLCPFFPKMSYFCQEKSCLRHSTFPFSLQKQKFFSLATETDLHGLHDGVINWDLGKRNKPFYDTNKKLSKLLCLQATKAIKIITKEPEYYIDKIILFIPDVKTCHHFVICKSQT